LSNNPFGEKGVIALQEMMAVNWSICDLRLLSTGAGNFTQPKGASALACIEIACIRNTTNQALNVVTRSFGHAHWEPLLSHVISEYAFPAVPDLWFSELTFESIGIDEQESFAYTGLHTI